MHSHRANKKNFTHKVYGKVGSSTDLPKWNELFSSSHKHTHLTSLFCVLQQTLFLKFYQLKSVYTFDSFKHSQRRNGLSNSFLRLGKSTAGIRFIDNTSAFLEEWESLAVTWICSQTFGPCATPPWHEWRSIWSCNNRTAALTVV